MRVPVLGVTIGALLLAALFMLQMAGCGGGSKQQNNIQPPPGADPMGTVNAQQLPDCSSVNGQGGEPNGVCYDVTVSCPGVADITTAVKVNNPSVPSIGTVTFTVGGGGIPWWDQVFAYGTTAVDTVLQAGYTTVQISFPHPPIGFPPGGNFAGWLTGPGGPRKLACRWVTTLRWVHDNIQQPNTPLCTTGNSAGAAVAGYALAHYGQDPIIKFVQETSGPPFTRIDHGCICNAPDQMTPCGQGLQSECFLINATRFVDPAYDPGPNSANICTTAVKTHDTSNQDLFFNDSLASSDATFSFPNVSMHFVIGGQDPGSAVPEAMEWQPLLTVKGGVQNICVADAGHEIADVLDGAQAVANDMIASCK